MASRFISGFSNDRVPQDQLELLMRMLVICSAVLICFNLYHLVKIVVVVVIIIIIIIITIMIIITIIIITMIIIIIIVFGTNGGMGADCNWFLKRLVEKLSEKNKEPSHITITWIRTLLSFEIFRSVHTYVRGSRAPFHKIPQGNFIDDCLL